MNQPAITDAGGPDPRARYEVYVQPRRSIGIRQVGQSMQRVRRGCFELVWLKYGKGEWEYVRR